MSQGIRWGYAFLKTSSVLSIEEKDKILLYAIKMYLNEEKQLGVEGENWEGRITSTNTHYTLGTFCGRKFEAEVHTNVDNGKCGISFLVTEYKTPGLN